MTDTDFEALRGRVRGTAAAGKAVHRTDDERSAIRVADVRVRAVQRGALGQVIRRANRELPRALVVPGRGERLDAAARHLAIRTLDRPQADRRLQTDVPVALVERANRQVAVIAGELDDTEVIRTTEVPVRAVVSRGRSPIMLIGSASWSNTSSRGRLMKILSSKERITQF